MKRTDPLVRKRCRELYGDKWYEVDKKIRQEEAIKHFSETVSAQSTKETQIIHDAVNKSGYKVVSITKVSNQSMLTCYNALKNRLNNASETPILFHGTTADAAHNITKSGFNRSYCGRNATVYGKGVYFARDISYSLHPQYSPANATGEKIVIAARVMTGKIALGHDSMLEPPSGYDSTTNSTANPTIFVVYKDFQALPEYVIRVQGS